MSTWSNDWGHATCIDDYTQYKIFGKIPGDSSGAIHIEITACDPNARADPSTCETDEAKINDYIDRNEFRLFIITNYETYNTQEYEDKTTTSKSVIDFYDIKSTDRDSVYWQTSLNKIQSEESFLPIIRDSVDYEFY